MILLSIALILVLFILLAFAMGAVRKAPDTSESASDGKTRTNYREAAEDRQRDAPFDGKGGKFGGGGSSGDW